MVKRAIIIITLITSLLGLAVTELILVKSFINTIEDDVNELVVLYEENKDDITTLVPEVEKVEKNWDSKEQMLCLMFNHKDITMITDCITRLIEYSKQNKYDDAIVDLKILQKYAEKNHDIMEFNINNIL